ncbi:glycosyltransferase [Sphingobium aromaticiconvertens]|uniref:glycosyltransferase family 4 protein n=1 Tax=Sphingobium aromaticiconvertens TaxID=365341 RepID=UPI003018A67D
MSRLLIVQYAGDYRDAWRQLAETGTETYHAHAYVFETLAQISEHFGEAGLLCCNSAEDYRDRLFGTVTAIGVAASPDRQASKVIRAIEDYAPTHLLIHGPMPRLLAWGLRQRFRLACIFADSFETGAVRRWLKFGALASLLNHPKIEWIANHGVNACLSLQRIGVDDRKVVIWDWPHTRHPQHNDAQAGPGKPPHILLYVGSIIPSKGIGDLLRAIALLRKRGLPVVAHIAGSGQSEKFESMAKKLGIIDHVTFLGPVPNAAIPALMRDSAAVIIPSRHSYPEGLPLTIYEALSSRTPIVASDHPMFSGHLIDGVTAMSFAERDPVGLANAVERLLADPALYGKLSDASTDTWRAMQCDTKWGDLLHHWMANDPTWFDQRSIRNMKRPGAQVA